MLNLFTKIRMQLSFDKIKPRYVGGVNIMADGTKIPMKVKRFDQRYLYQRPFELREMEPKINGQPIPFPMPMKGSDVKFTTARGFITTFMKTDHLELNFIVTKRNGLIKIDFELTSKQNLNAYGHRYEDVICNNSSKYSNKSDTYTYYEATFGKHKVIYSCELDCIYNNNGRSKPMEVKIARSNRWGSYQQTCAWLQCYLGGIDTIILGEFMLKRDKAVFTKTRLININDRRYMSEVNMDNCVKGLNRFVRLLDVLDKECKEGDSYIYIRYGKNTKLPRKHRRRRVYTSAENCYRIDLNM